MSRLRVTRAQMQAPLQDDQAFAKNYINGFMKTHLPGFYWAITAEGRVEMVLQGRHYARHFGINDTPSQMMFVTLMWQIGPNFFAFPGFAEVAGASNLDGPAKINGFYNVKRTQAVAAIQGADDRWWYPASLPPPPSAAAS